MLIHSRNIVYRHTAFLLRVRMRHVSNVHIIPPSLLTCLLNSHKKRRKITRPESVPSSHVLCLRTPRRKQCLSLPRKLALQHLNNRAPSTQNTFNLRHRFSLSRRHRFLRVPARVTCLAFPQWKRLRCPWAPQRLMSIYVSCSVQGTFST